MGERVYLPSIFLNEQNRVKECALRFQTLKGYLSHSNLGVYSANFGFRTLVFITPDVYSAYDCLLS